MSATPYRRAVIVGLGLLGGSVALALKKKGLARRVVALGRELSRLRPALKAGIVDEASVDWSAAKGADLIVLCGPFETFEAQLKALAKVAPAGCLVTDVGSVKGPAVGRWHRAAGALRFVAAHPMAGGEKTGWKNSRASLFEGQACILTPLPRSSRAAVLEAGQLWQALGAEVALLSPQEHDRLVGRVSHLPHAVAFALCAALEKQGRSKDFAFAGNGFWDSTRVAASDPLLWAQIFSANAKPLAAGLQAAIKELRALQALVKRGKVPALSKALGRASRFRQAVDRRRAQR